MLFSSRDHNYPDDIFDDTRMSFGDHLEELRARLVKALYWLGFFLVIGFVLDTVGQSIGQPSLGVGRPMLAVITAPVENQVRDFYARRNENALKKIAASQEVDKETLSAARAAAEAKLKANNGDLTALNTAEREVLVGKPEAMRVIIPVADLAKAFGPPKDPAITEIQTTLQVYPAELNYLSLRGETVLGNKQYLTTLSVQEAFMVYFKVSLLCGVVLASPFMFYHMWAFIAAGLYPHERRYVHLYLPASVFLFLFGIALCQFIVLPGAVKSLLAFNNWIELDPDLRLNEWLGFAILLPIVFGASFQTPLVMFFLNRLGMFGWDDYLSKWRHAFLGLAVFAAVITPTPDAVTMLYLFVPMMGLYLLGVGVCWVAPGVDPRDTDDDAQVAV